MSPSFSDWPVQAHHLEQCQEADARSRRLTSALIAALWIATGLLYSALAVLLCPRESLPFALLVGAVACPTFWLLMEHLGHPWVRTHVGQLEFLRPRVQPAPIGQIHTTLRAILQEHGLAIYAGERVRTTLSRDRTTTPTRPLLLVDNAPLPLCPVQEATLVVMESRGSGAWGLPPDTPNLYLDIEGTPLSAHDRLALTRHLAQRAARAGHGS